MNERVLLVNPWIYDFKAFDFWMKPLGLLYIASYLKKAGYEIDYIDLLDRNHPLLNKRIFKLPKTDQFGRGKFHNEEIEKPTLYKNIPRKYKRYGLPIDIFNQLLDKIRTPDFICITSIMTYWYPGVFEVIKILKIRFPKTPIILGGIYATLCYEHAQNKSGADFVISGPAEKKLHQILSRLQPISFNELPYPAFDLYSKLDYACIVTTQGCPFSCQYCAVPNLNPELIFRSTDSVIGEIEYYKKLDVKNIAFYDDALLVNPDFPDILDEIIKRKIQVYFHTPNGLHPRFINQTIADKMHQVGFKTIYLSLETSDSSIRNSLDNKVTVQEFQNAVKYLKNSGFKKEQLHSYHMIGMPELKPEQIIKSIDFVTNLSVNAHLAEFSPIPKTQAYTKLGFSDETDPLLHNNAIFPVLDLTMQEKMSEVKAYLSRLRHKSNNS